MGRLTRDPDVRYSQGDQSMAIARYTLAVDRRRSRSAQTADQQTADFISCVAFGRQGEFAEKYLHKGIKICVAGHIQTGSYTRQDGTKVYTTDVVIDDQEFAESRNAQSAGNDYSNYAAPGRSYAPSQSAPAPQQAVSGAGQAPAANSPQPSQYAPAGQQNAPSGQDTGSSAGTSSAIDGFMNIPDGIDEELPFN